MGFMTEISEVKNKKCRTDIHRKIDSKQARTLALLQTPNAQWQDEGKTAHTEKNS